MAAPKRDVGWKYGNLEDGKLKCKLCGRLAGGITRLKRHIAGISGEIAPCTNSSEDAKKKCRKAINKRQKKNPAQENKRHAGLRYVREMKYLKDELKRLEEMAMENRVGIQDLQSRRRLQRREEESEEEEGEGEDGREEDGQEEDGAILGSPELETPIEWPLDGKLSLKWVHNLMAVFDWFSRNQTPTQFSTVLPFPVFDSLILSATKILNEELNCLMIDCSPDSTVVVVGDVHGQLHDFLYLLNDARYPSENRTFVFNGDYVDRGAWGLETLLILLAWKVLMPRRVYLLRGNHESEYCTTTFGFKGEVLVKYGANGEQVYKKCLDCFETLPLASIINGRVFTAHGGLFRKPLKRRKAKKKRGNNLVLGSLEDLLKAERRVREPLWDDSNFIPADMMWSDPSMKPGLSRNKGRGIGLLWGPDCTEDFLKKFQLKLVIRSHEGPDARNHERQQEGFGCMGEGYTIDHNVESGKLITLFSAPDYPQFQDTEDRSKNKGAFIVLEPPDFDGPVFCSFEAVTPRPQVEPYYVEVGSDEEVDGERTQTSP